MTISTQSSAIQVSCNGSQQAFAFSFIGDSVNDIVVTSISATGTYTVLTTGYTVILNAAVANQLWSVGGQVTFNTAPAAGTQLIIARSLPLTQQTSIQNQGNYYSQVVETALDTLCMEIQQVSAKTGQFRGTWATGVAYNFGDMVVDGTNGANTGNYYTCAIANTSGTWATDLSNGDWTLMFNTQLVAGYATSAAASATSASNSATSASSSASSASTSASQAATSATNAATSATQAAAAASALVIGTSLTSNTIGTGALTFTTQAGLPLVTGGWVQITDAANGANYVYGQITSYSGTTLVINSTATGGSGTKTSWKITLAPAATAGGTTGQIQYNNAGVLGGVSAVSVADGGTGLSLFTTNMPICGGATATGILQQVSGGSTGYVLTSTGITGLPTFQTVAGGTTQQIQYNNAGILGGVSNASTGYLLTSTGLGTLPTFQAPSAGLMTALGVGALILGASGTNLVAGGSIAAASLTAYGINTSGAPQSTGDSLSGTWRNLESCTANTSVNWLVLWQRIA